jgi:hypothetical protein
MHPRPACAPLLVATILLGTALAGCGKSLPGEGQSRGAGVGTVAGTGALGASGLATRNTTRLGGAGPVADAAAVALAVKPGLTPATRPLAVVLVDEHDWPAALAAAALASSPLGAPLLYSDGNTLPALSREALAAMKPLGAAALGGAQVIEIGTSAAPAGYLTRSLSVATPGVGAAAGGHPPAGGSASGTGPAGDEQSDSGPAALAAQVERLVATVHGAPPRRVIVIGADGPPALAMPAAGLAAESGAPILPVDAAGIPPATRRVLAHLHHPVIYAVGPPAAVSDAVLAALNRFGPVRRIDSETATADPTLNAIAVARFVDGTFGWDVNEAGHGLVFANASRPLDAPAAAPLSASGDYGPLLLLGGPTQVPTTLARYLEDIQPGYTAQVQPVRGVYNHGWLIGDINAISATTQAELDTLLEIKLEAGAGATNPSPSSPELEPSAAP